MLILLMGVSGSGKTTIGRRIAEHLGWDFIEGDDYHPANNINKMTHGEPLTDSDREPWLDALETVISELSVVGKSAIVSCSALKREYRTRLRRTSSAMQLVFLDIDQRSAIARLKHRFGHFAGPQLAASQFDALEPPTADEAWIIDASGSIDETARKILQRIPGVDQAL